MSKGQDSMSTVGIMGVGAGIPAGRLEAAEIAAAWDSRAGKSTVAVCGPDEDCLTLGWLAGTSALEHAGIDGGDVGGLWWGTARPPVPEGPSLAYLAAALGLSSSVAGLLASGSTHAGMDALGAACDAVDAGSVSVALVVVSDNLIPGLGTASERASGAGAVALVLRSSDNAPATLLRRAYRTRPILDRYRGVDQDGTGDPYDARLYREREFLPAVEAARLALGDVPEQTRWSVPDPDGRLGRAAAATVGTSDALSGTLQRRIGDVGAPAALLGCLAGLTEPGPVGIIALGGGRSSGWLLEVNFAVPGVTHSLAEIDGGNRGTRAMSYASVLRARGQLSPMSDPIPMGVPPGSAAFVRGADEILGLLGRRCEECATISVPPSIHPVCPTCAAQGGENVRLARTGSVHTFVINHTMPPPFEAPLPICVVDLDDGARVMLQGLPDDAADLEVGDRVALELRRYALERGTPVYGFKVRRDK